MAQLCLPTARTRPLSRPLAGLCLLVAGTVPASAQGTTISPSSDWNGNYGFSSTADRNLRLLRSDLIKKADEGYYESLSNTYNVTNNSWTEIGQQTTTIGSINTATNNIDVRDSTNIGLDLENSSTNTGCLNGSITIDSRPNDVGATTCK